MRADGKGRSRVGDISICLSVDNKQIKAMTAGCVEQINSMDGFPALIERRRRQNKVKQRGDQTALMELTRKVEEWLVKDSQFASLFTNDILPMFKNEAARKIVFDAKVAVSSQVKKMEADIEEELSPAKKNPAPAFVPSPLELSQSNLFYEKSFHTTMRHDTSRVAEVHPHVPKGHRLLRDIIGNLL